MDGCYGGACNLPGFGGQSPFLNLGPQQIGFQSFGTTSNGLFVYYKYAVKKEVGPKVIPGTRDFCKTMINERTNVSSKNNLYSRSSRHH